MSIGRICCREVYFIEPGESAATAAVRMRDSSVGTLVIMNAKQAPLGMVTDRDLVTRVMATGNNPAEIQVAAIMTTPAETVREDCPIEDAVARMRRSQIRRLIVVDASGRLVGIASVDDVVSLLAEEMNRVGHLLDAQANQADTTCP
jgi:CBS domain-containing protein